MPIRSSCALRAPRLALDREAPVRLPLTWRKPSIQRFGFRAAPVNASPRRGSDVRTRPAHSARHASHLHPASETAMTASLSAKALPSAGEKPRRPECGEGRRHPPRPAPAGSPGHGRRDAGSEGRDGVGEASSLGRAGLGLRPDGRKPIAMGGDMRQSGAGALQDRIHAITQGGTVRLQPGPAPASR